MRSATLDEFESVMLRLAEAMEWTFCDEEEEVAAEGVFNDETYAPALLLTAQTELDTRGMQVDLGIDYESRPDALFGVAAVSRPDASIKEAIWRLALASYVVENLPVRGSALDLSLLREVFAQQPTPRMVRV